MADSVMERRRAPPASPRIIFTGFGVDERKYLTTKAVRLGADIYTAEGFDQSCTYLVSKRPSRSEKYLAACALGRWVVDARFVIESHRLGHWIDPASFEFQDPGPKRCRQHWAKYGYGPFTNWAAAVLVDDLSKGEVYSRSEIVKRLLRLGGATVVTLRLPENGRPFWKKEHIRGLSHIFADGDNKTVLQQFLGDTVPVFEPAYIGDFLLMDTVLKPVEDRTASGVNNIENGPCQERALGTLSRSQNARTKSADCRPISTDSLISSVTESRSGSNVSRSIERKSRSVSKDARSNVKESRPVSNDSKANIRDSRSRSTDLKTKDAHTKSLESGSVGKHMTNCGPVTGHVQSCSRVTTADLSSREAGGNVAKLTGSSGKPIVTKRPFIDARKEKNESDRGDDMEPIHKRKKLNECAPGKNQSKPVHTKRSGLHYQQTKTQQTEGSVVPPVHKKATSGVSSTQLNLRPTVLLVDVAQNLYPEKTLQLGPADPVSERGNKMREPNEPSNTPSCSNNSMGLGTETNPIVLDDTPIVMVQRTLKLEPPSILNTPAKLCLSRDEPSPFHSAKKGATPAKAGHVNSTPMKEDLEAKLNTKVTPNVTPAKMSTPVKGLERTPKMGTSPATSVGKSPARKPITARGRRFQSKDSPSMQRFTQGTLFSFIKTTKKTETIPPPSPASDFTSPVLQTGRQLFATPKATASTPGAAGSTAINMLRTKDPLSVVLCNEDPLYGLEAKKSSTKTFLHGSPSSKAVGMACNEEPKSSIGAKRSSKIKSVCDNRSSATVNMPCSEANRSTNNGQLSRSKDVLTASGRAVTEGQDTEVTIETRSDCLSKKQSRVVSVRRNLKHQLSNSDSPASLSCQERASQFVRNINVVNATKTQPDTGVTKQPNDRDGSSRSELTNTLSSFSSIETFDLIDLNVNVQDVTRCTTSTKDKFSSLPYESDSEICDLPDLTGNVGRMTQGVLSFKDKLISSAYESNVEACELPDLTANTGTMAQGSITSNTEDSCESQSLLCNIKNQSTLINSEDTMEYSAPSSDQNYTAIRLPMKTIQIHLERCDSPLSLPDLDPENIILMKKLSFIESSGSQGNSTDDNIKPVQTGDNMVGLHNADSALSLPNLGVPGRWPSKDQATVSSTDSQRVDNNATANVKPPSGSPQVEIDIVKSECPLADDVAIGGTCIEIGTVRMVPDSTISLPDLPLPEVSCKDEDCLPDSQHSLPDLEPVPNIKIERILSQESAQQFADQTSSTVSNRSELSPTNSQSGTNEPRASNSVKVERDLLNQTVEKPKRAGRRVVRLKRPSDEAVPRQGEGTVRVPAGNLQTDAELARENPWKNDSPHCLKNAGWLPWISAKPRLQVQCLYSDMSEKDVDITIQVAPHTFTLFMDALLEDELYPQCIELMEACVTSQTYPDVAVVRYLVQRIMMESECPIVCEGAYKLLLRLLDLYPPQTPSMQHVYVTAILAANEQEADDIHTSGVQELTNQRLWNVFRDCVRKALHWTSDGCLDRVNNFAYIVKFFQHLFEKDFQAFKLRQQSCKSRFQGQAGVVIPMMWPCGTLSVGFLTQKCTELIHLLVEVLKFGEMDNEEPDFNSAALRSLLSCLQTLLAIVLQICYIDDRRLALKGSTACVIRESIEIDEYRRSAKVMDLLKAFAMVIQSSCLTCKQTDEILRTMNDAKASLLLCELLLDYYDQSLLPLVTSPCSYIVLPSNECVHSNEAVLYSNTGRSRRKVALQQNKENEIDCEVVSSTKVTRSWTYRSLSLKRIVSEVFYLLPPLSVAVPKSSHRKRRKLESSEQGQKESDSSESQGSLTKTALRQHNYACQPESAQKGNGSGSRLNNQSRQETPRSPAPGAENVVLDASVKRKMNTVNKRNAKGETALLRACIANNVTKIRELLRVPGIDVNAQDFAGWSPLHEACNRGHLEAVQELLKYRPAKTMTSFFNKGKKSECGRIDLLSRSDDEGITPLHDAVANNNVAVARLLLEHGGELLLHARCHKNQTALDVAVSVEMRELLLNPPNSTVKGTPRKRKYIASLDDTVESLLSQSSTLSSLDLAAAHSNIGYQPSLELYQENLDPESLLSQSSNLSSPDVAAAHSNLGYQPRLELYQEILESDSSVGEKFVDRNELDKFCTIVYYLVSNYVVASGLMQETSSKTLGSETSQESSEKTVASSSVASTVAYTVPSHSENSLESVNSDQRSSDDHMYSKKACENDVQCSSLNASRKKTIRTVAESASDQAHSSVIRHSTRIEHRQDVKASVASSQPINASDSDHMVAHVSSSDQSEASSHSSEDLQVLREFSMHARAFKSHVRLLSQNLELSAQCKLLLTCLKSIRGK